MIAVNHWLMEQEIFFLKVFWHLIIDIKNVLIFLWSMLKNKIVSCFSVVYFDVRDNNLWTALICAKCQFRQAFNYSHTWCRCQSSGAKQNVGRKWIYDESSFWLRAARTRISVKKYTHHHGVRTVKHPAKVHVYGYISANGFCSMTVFKDTFNNVGMLHFYKRRLLKSAKKLLCNENWIMELRVWISRRMPIRSKMFAPI